MGKGAAGTKMTGTRLGKVFTGAGMSVGTFLVGTLEGVAGGGDMVESAFVTKLAVPMKVELAGDNGGGHFGLK